MLVHVRTVQVHARLETERVPGTQATGTDPGRGQAGPELGRAIARQDDLPSVLARIAGAGDEQVADAGGEERGQGHGRFATVGGQTGGGLLARLRALDRDHGQVGPFAVDVDAGQALVPGHDHRVTHGLDGRPQRGHVDAAVGRAQQVLRLVAMLLAREVLAVASLETGDPAEAVGQPFDELALDEMGANDFAAMFGLQVLVEDIPDNHDQIGCCLQKQLLVGDHDATGLLGMGPAADAQVVVRVGQLEILEEGIRHGAVIVLAGVDDDGLGPFLRFKRMVEGCDLHEVRPRSGYQMDCF